MFYKFIVKLDSFFETNYSSLPEKCKLKPSQGWCSVNSVDVNEFGAYSLHRGATVNLGLPSALRPDVDICQQTSSKLPDNGLSWATP